MVKVGSQKGLGLFSGNEAIAAGAFEANVSLGTGYPGTPATEILENLVLYPGVYAEWCPNEKVAVEVALGASFAGYRALSTMKHVGLNVASDPFVTAVYTGVNGGLVIVSADDPGMHSSQNEQDNRHYARLSYAPMFEPSDPQEAYLMIKEAFEVSERFDIPVLFRTTTRVAHSRQNMSIEGLRKDREPLFVRSAEKYVMVPSNARKRKKDLLIRVRRIKEYSESTDFNFIELNSHEVGIVTSGPAYLYIKECFPEASVLKIGFSYPLPEKLIRKLAQEVELLLVVEELDSIMETEIKSLGINCYGKEFFPADGELTPGIVADGIIKAMTSLKQKSYAIGWTSSERVEKIPERPPVLCAGCGHRNLFYVLKKMRAIVTGDIGCYTLAVNPPLSAMDTCVCMGASIGEAHGFEKVQPEESKKKVVAVIGDSTFVHSGITGLVNAVYNNGKSTIIILDNRTTAMTGHQDHPGTGVTLKGEKTVELDFEKLAKAIGVKYIAVVDPYNMKETEKALREAIEFDGVSLVIVRRPCVLIEKKKKPPYYIDEEKCTGCWVCLRLGCPAISKKGDKAEIESYMCTGCGACEFLCRFDAIHLVKEKTDG